MSADIAETQTETAEEGCCPFVAKTLAWTNSVIVGLGLCPWATRAMDERRLRCVTCPADTPAAVECFIREEARRLCVEGVQPLSNTLIICPNVEAWKDFAAFEDWVAWQQQGLVDDAAASQLRPEDHASLERCHLVTFHPKFARWHGFPPDVDPIGTRIHSYYHEEDGQRSCETWPATVIEDDAEVVGVRRLGVEFQDGPEEIVPLEWTVQEGSRGPLLPDNAMHRAPFPTLHLIRRADTDSLQQDSGGLDAIWEMASRNSQHMAKIGWEGVPSSD